MSELLSGRPLYLRDGTDPVFGVFHSPARYPANSTAVLICPPFGWDDVCSYRSRREWAQHLCRAGLPTLRIDLPSTGDSGGSPRDGERLAAWTRTVVSAATRLQTLSELERVAAIGIGLGGMLVCKAVAEGAPIDEAVLWAVPARGRVFVRELRVFASLEEQSTAPQPAKGSGDGEDEVWAGGFLLSGETVRDFESLDLTELSFEGGRLSRALMLDRDGISVDGPLQSHLEASGVAVSLASGEGFGAMMAKPHNARAPRAVFDSVLEWFRAPMEPPPPGAEPVGAAGRRLRRGRRSVVIEGPAGPVEETPLTIPQPFGDMFSILCEAAGSEPAEPSEISVVMLNAGAIRRIGPNRMWVEAARRWAAAGIRTLRLDLEGIGDADGDAERFHELAELYVTRLVDQVLAALDELEHREKGRRFVLSGLCSGAYWAFHSALRDERVLGALLVNPQALIWHPSLEAERDLRKSLRSSSWQRLVKGEVPLRRITAAASMAPLAIPRRALARRQARRGGEDELAQMLDHLRDGGKRLHLIFSGKEPLHEELDRDGYLGRLDSWPNASVELIPGDIHTLRPRESQLRAHQALDRALESIAGRPIGKRRETGAETSAFRAA